MLGVFWFIWGIVFTLLQPSISMCGCLNKIIQTLSARSLSVLGVLLPMSSTLDVFAVSALDLGVNCITGELRRRYLELSRHFIKYYQRQYLKHPLHPSTVTLFISFQIECSSISEYSERIIKSNHLDSGKHCGCSSSLLLSPVCLHCASSAGWGAGNTVAVETDIVSEGEGRQDEEENGMGGHG